MIIMSEGFSPYYEYKTSFFCLCYYLSYDAKGEKTQNKAQKNPDTVFTLSYEMFQSHLFYGWIETISCCSFLKTNLICTLGNKSQQNIFLLTLNFTIVKPEENNRVVKWYCNAKETAAWYFFFSMITFLMIP